MESEHWANQHVRANTFPTPATKRIPAGTVVRTNDVTDFKPDVPQWRVYFTRLLAEAVNDALGWQNYTQVNADFETFTLQFPWGALDAAVEHVFPNSIAKVSQRIQAVLSFWMPLGLLRYVDTNLNPINLAQLMGNHYGSLLEMWLDRRSNDIRTDLQRAVDVMQDSRHEVVRDKIIALLSLLARKDRRIRNRERLIDPVWLDQEVSKLEPATFESMATGYVPDLLRNLLIMDELIGG
jgi:hypothetical protein